MGRSSWCSILLVALLAVSSRLAQATWCDAEHAISTGMFFTCGLAYGPDARCWGSGGKGQTTIPAELKSRAPKWLMSGGDATCALVQDDSAICWGDDAHGALDVPVGMKWKYITPGYQFTCGIEKGTHLGHCWGKNSNGQTEIPSGYRWQQIYSGENHACGVTDEGGPDPTHPTSADPSETHP